MPGTIPGHLRPGPSCVEWVPSGKDKDPAAPPVSRGSEIHPGGADNLAPTLHLGSEPAGQQVESPRTGTLELLGLRYVCVCETGIRGGTPRGGEGPQSPAPRAGHTRFRELMLHPRWPLGPLAETSLA